MRAIHNAHVCRYHIYLYVCKTRLCARVRGEREKNAREKNGRHACVRARRAVFFWSLSLSTLVAIELYSAVIRVCVCVCDLGEGAVAGIYPPRCRDCYYARRVRPRDTVILSPRQRPSDSSCIITVQAGGQWAAMMMMSRGGGKTPHPAGYRAQESGKFTLLVYTLLRAG